MHQRIACYTYYLSNKDPHESCTIRARRASECIAGLYRNSLAGTSGLYAPFA